MGVKNNVLLQEEWLDNIESIPDIQKQKDILYILIKYSRSGEIIETGDQMTDAYIRFICPQIDKIKQNYADRVEKGKTVGRKCSFDREELKKMIAEGHSGREIAKIFCVNESAIYHDPIWEERKKYNNYKPEK